MSFKARTLSQPLKDHKPVQLISVFPQYWSFRNHFWPTLSALRIHLLLQRYLGLSRAVASAPIDTVN